ncbi:MAG: ABC transporter ATP-binding protein [Erysipelotrichaceae bacterium]|nr:ABC transporter ATP-binding protein [Erysipelotrichaceae bacterium]
MEKQKTLLKVENLSKEYGQGESKVIALNDVSFEIYDGELLVILGSSGSGKSTLLNMIGGMDYPTSGQILYDDEDITKFNDVKLTNYRDKNIGFVFQSFNLIQELTAKENIDICMAKENIEAVDNVLDIVKLKEKKFKYPRELSGGEQQRVSIARALVKDAPMLLCDEPTGALDYETGKAILIKLEELSRVYHKCVVIVTHTKEMAKIADRVLYMRNGQITKIEQNNNIVSAKDIEW